MKLKKAEVFNFASYNHLEFNFENLGLSLVHGPTGSGKSTLQDIPCWILYGKTAKGGSVDEVRNWQSNEPVQGILSLVTSDNKDILVTRIRGKTNDLYWIEDDKTYRGKDVSETQLLLDIRTGASFDDYCASAYFNEFSETSIFFLAKAKEKRSILEKCANLDLAIRLADKASNERKKTKKEFEVIKITLSKELGKIEQLKASIISTQRAIEAYDDQKKENIAILNAKADNFDLEKSSKIAALETRSQSFENTKNKKIDAVVTAIEKLNSKIVDQSEIDARVTYAQDKLTALSYETCSSCGAPITSISAEKCKNELDRLKSLTLQNSQLIDRRKWEYKELNLLSEMRNPYLSELEAAKTLENKYNQQAIEESNRPNPFIRELQKLNSTLKTLKSLTSELSSKQEELEAKNNGLNRLYDISYSLRGELLRKSISFIQDKTNHYLSRYFESDISVYFSLLDSDDLEAEIRKNSNSCVYTQLSKGQRQLLNLCFVLSIMEACSNKIGIHFNTLFFDEALDGMDAELKIKAYYLFEDLQKQHSSILIVDHFPEFQQMFNRRYKVSLEADYSTVEESNG